MTITVNDEQKPGRLRWIRESPEGGPVVSETDGTWRLYLWGPVAIINCATEAVEEDGTPDEPSTEAADDCEEVRGGRMAADGCAAEPDVTTCR